MIEVRLFATFRNGREKIIFLKAGEFANIEQILVHLNIAASDVAICLINGFHSKSDDSVKDGDIIALFPPVGGG